VKPLVLALALGAALAGCLDRLAERAAADSSVPDSRDEPESLLGVDPRVRARNLAKRFPGVRKIDLVKVVISTRERRGPCWTDVSSTEETGIEASYAIEGETNGRRATSPADLEAQGWRRVYRTPEGKGFELRAPFRSVDLTLDTGFTCVCSRTEPTAARDLLEGDRRSVRLRLRWTAGSMPEVSARTTNGTGASGLRPTLTSGDLFGWEFETEAPYPGRNVGRCGVRIDLGLLLDPAIQ
jgi:hypothetical protein